MKQPATISIVIPSYNQGRYLSEAIGSVLEQRGISPDQRQIIVIDGGSTDESLDVIRQFSPHLHHWVSEPDRGQTHALIKGFQVTSGDILGWLNSDDVLEPWTLSEVLHHFASHTEDRFIYGDEEWITTSGQHLRTRREISFNWFIWLFDHNYIPQPAAFWTRDLYNEVGGLSEEFDLSMDADLFSRFAVVTRPRHIRRQWAKMRFYPEQKNQRLRDRADIEGQIIRRRLGAVCGGWRFEFLKLCACSARRVWKLSAGCYSRRDAAAAIRTFCGRL